MARKKSDKEVITVAFTPDNLDFLDSISKIIGTDRTSYLNMLVYNERMSLLLKNEEPDTEKKECVPLLDNRDTFGT